MIGHLQTNKVKYIIDKVDLIHSVDSFKLAETIEKEAAKHNLTANILIEVNVAQEESKFGLKTEEVLPFIEKIANFEHIKVCGLMTIAPLSITRKKIVKFSQIYINYLLTLMRKTLIMFM